MKHLTEYLSASEKKYVYRIKVAGELPTENYDAFKAGLGMFDVEECTAPKKTPIQADPLGFPGLTNEEIHIFDVTLNYPANNEQIAELARRAGIGRERVLVIEKEFNDSMIKDLEGSQEEGPLLGTDHPEQSKEQKEASDAYADSFQEAAKEFANDGGAEFEIAGGDTPDAKFNTDEEDGKESPMTNTTRQSIMDVLK